VGATDASLQAAFEQADDVTDVGGESHEDYVDEPDGPSPCWSVTAVVRRDAANRLLNGYKGFTEW
jgi:hypothetical protein